MKNRVLLCVVCILIVMMGIPTYASETPIKVVVNDETLKFDVDPQTVEGRTLVPFRGIFEALGADIDWDATDKVAIGKTASTIIKLPIGKNWATVNSKQVKLDVPATIIQGRTFVPVRFIAESLGATVGWDSQTKTVKIDKNSDKEHVKDYSICIAGGNGFYTGEMEEQRAHGNGIMEFSGANSMRVVKYEGEFRNNKFVGKGTLEYVNGDKYQGEFVDNKRNGKGTFTWDNGDEYVGVWKDDLRSGQGTKAWDNGDKYVGSWDNDKANGEGTKTWANGDKYVGTWKDDLRSNQGTMTWANGDQYVGEWKEDQLDGKGTLTLANGEKFEGKWKKGLKDGRGKLTDVNGKVTSGIWEEDKLTVNDEDWKAN
ncbi:copper amine oxidase N-terminal domain-containing protein [Crassaminicella profunda]|uniref:copper amine oxidase N-terminal domain-containing protein n=1 Tax=Crassaminicella profunda TaxID=1286698 RepID=UPI001CA6E21B|nr:copper amine oxidase N-terminal domain-containing protein [Crassaminicella profunda]QZY55497.1 hypothetical protein K7H06_00140 [Crassaminicella profunda]